MTGAYNAFPMQPGGAAERPLELITKGLLDALGTAFGDEQEDYNWVEIHAYARAILEIYNQVQRLVSSFDPNRMSWEMLARWERILTIYPSPAETYAERRSRVAARMALEGQAPTISNLYDTALAQLGSNAFVRVSRNNETMDNMSFQPDGITITGGQTVADGAYSSGIYFIEIETVKPSGMKLGDYLVAVGNLEDLINRWLPAHVNYDATWDTAGQNAFVLDDSELDFDAFGDITASCGYFWMDPCGLGFTCVDGECVPIGE